MTMILWILAGACLLYLLLLLILGLNSFFLVFWLAAALGFGGLALMRKRVKVSKTVKRIFLVTVTIGLLIFALVEGMILSHCGDKGQENLDYVVVLGAQVRGRTVSLSLKQRLDTAYDYLAANPETVVIVSGGQGRGEEVTEAYAMAEYLANRGIDPSRIIQEDESTNTEENMSFSLALMEGENPTVGIVTSDFHVFRAVRIAQKMGISQAEGIASPSAFYLYPQFLCREFFAVVKYFLAGAI